MNTKTENLLAQEIKQSDIETKVYNHHAQFYQYVESDENKTIVEAEDRPQRRNFLKTALVIAIGFCLTSGLASAFYFSSWKISSGTVNQLSAENLPKDENRAGSVEEDGSQNELEAGKSLKSDLPVEKGNLIDKDNPIRKEVVGTIETKTAKTNEQPEKVSLPTRTSKEFPKTTAETPVDSPTRTTNPNLPVQTTPNDARREFWTGSRQNKNARNQQSFQNRRNEALPNNDGEFREFREERREFLLKKIKQTRFERRSNIRERLQNQRRKN